jgi:hypothetical protein
MADVIFSGTDSRQALGMAEVSRLAECEKNWASNGMKFASPGAICEGKGDRF